MIGSDTRGPTPSLGTVMLRAFMSVFYRCLEVAVVNYTNSFSDF